MGGIQGLESSIVLGVMEMLVHASVLVNVQKHRSCVYCRSHVSLECKVCEGAAADAWELLLLQYCFTGKVLSHSLWISRDFSTTS